MSIYNSALKWGISILFLLSFADCRAQEILPEVDINTESVNQYYQMDKLLLPFDEVIALATKIVPKRTEYEPNTVAMAYALLADIADIKGESSRAIQLATFGLTYRPISPEVELNLKLKLASGYFFKNQYRELIDFIEEVISLAERTDNKKYRINALAYRAMANAFLGLHDKSLEDLLVVEQVVNVDKEFPNYIELYEILAISQHYLGNHDVSLSLFEKVLEKRFDMNTLIGIESTYRQLAQVYLNMGQLDDAYNAFWEAKNYAVKFKLPIKIAYAELGIGSVMLKQGEHETAFKSLVEAQNLFSGQNLNQPYLNTLIRLISASKHTGRDEFAQDLLHQAKDLAQIMELNSDHASLFLLLSEHYEQQGNMVEALSAMKRYIELDEHNIQFVPSSANLTANNVHVERSKLQTLKVVELSENKANVTAEHNGSQRTIFFLSIICLFLLAFLTYQWLKFRSLRQNFFYDQNERPNYALMSPIETKRLYHQTYKKARKYEYPLSVAYIEIKNWQDLEFSYSKKTVNEVVKTIGTLINDHLGEFDYAGQINDGEYLVMYPHQSVTDAQIKLDRLMEALKVRFFANLGDFSVDTRFSLDTPSVQDIDPYIFLSRLSEN